MRCASGEGVRCGIATGKSGSRLKPRSRAQLQSARCSWRVGKGAESRAPQPQIVMKQGCKCSGWRSRGVCAMSHVLLKYSTYGDIFPVPQTTIILQSLYAHRMEGDEPDCAGYAALEKGRIGSLLTSRCYGNRRERAGPACSRRRPSVASTDDGFSGGLVSREGV